MKMTPQILTVALETLSCLTPVPFSVSSHAILSCARHVLGALATSAFFYCAPPTSWPSHMPFLHTGTAFHWPLAEAFQFAGVTVNTTCLGKASLISPIDYMLHSLRPDMCPSPPGLFLDGRVTTGFTHLPSAYLSCQSTNSVTAGITSAPFTTVHRAPVEGQGPGRCPVIIWKKTNSSDWLSESFLNHKDPSPQLPPSLIKPSNLKLSPGLTVYWEERKTESTAPCKACCPLTSSPSSQPHFLSLLPDAPRPRQTQLFCLLTPPHQALRSGAWLFCWILLPASLCGEL